MIVELMSCNDSHYNDIYIDNASINKNNSPLCFGIINIYGTDLLNSKYSAALFVAVTVAHVDTTDVSQVLSMAFLQVLPPYTLTSLR